MRMLEIHVEVSDLEKSLALYVQLIPHVKVSHWEDRSAVALILEDGTAFGIWKKGKVGMYDARAGEHVHFALQIHTEEYQDFKNRIESAGLSAIEHQWPEGHKSLYFFDYDGNQGEYMTADWLGNSSSLT